MFPLLLPALALCGAAAWWKDDAGQQPEAPAPTERVAGPAAASVNITGGVDADKGESRRNENVHFNLIDNNALKEIMGRIGATATVVRDFDPNRRYFGAEFGAPVSDPLRLSAPEGRSPLRGSLRFGHGNSIFNARTFFQVGDLKPARENSFSARAGAPAWRGAWLHADVSGIRIRGSVNGNVLVPMPHERTPLATDPELLPIVRRYLGSYPSELPNRTDVNPRMLNTNAPRRVDDDAVALRLDQQGGASDRLSLAYRFGLQNVEAFQLVAGQNPDTTTSAHRARATWSRQVSADTSISASASFGRTGSLLVPEKNAVGAMVGVSGVITGLGPGPEIPIDRAENAFRYGAEASRQWKRHTVVAGFEFARTQLNGYEASDHRGVLQFVNDFGRDALTNLRMGAPSWLYGAFGNVHRGYRQWQASWYIDERWRATDRLGLHAGLRHEAAARPTEVNGIDVVPYGGDWNNLAPQFGFAWALPGAWGALRGAYGLHYGQIYPVTTGQARYNPPNSTMFQLRLPDLRVPMRELMRQGAGAGLPPRLTVFSPELTTPYSHQYNFGWQASPRKDVSVELAYIGSRSRKLLSMWFLNRAVPAAGVPQTFETIQQRRANPSDGEHRTILNGSAGYLDAARATVQFRRWCGVSAELSYWWSKALTLGPDHTNTASGSDAYGFFSPSQFDIHREMKGPTDFDQPHALLLRGSYQLPAGLRASPVNRIAKGWNIGVVALVKSGTPFSVQTGSDAPGFGNVDGTSGDRPNLVDASVLGRTVGHPDSSRRLLPKSAFAFIEPGAIRGNLGWNTFRKGGIANVNASLSRQFPIGHDREIVFRVESNNLGNTPQFSAPGSRLTNPEFAVITNTLNDGRAFRLVFELEF